MTTTANEPATAAPKVFGLRFAQPMTGKSLPAPALYSDADQLNLCADGTEWWRRIDAMTMKTTGPSPDGGGSTGGEEYTPDFGGDA